MASLLSRLLAGLGIAAAAAQPAGASGQAVHAELVVGRPIVVEAPSPGGRFGVVFEDDGDTGYFYALDFSAGDNPIQEAVAIYNAAQVTDRGKPSRLAIAWSRDGLAAGLWINDHPHAVFDFARQRGYSRTNFPPPGKWKSYDFAWDDAALDLFR